MLVVRCRSSFVNRRGTQRLACNRLATIRFGTNSFNCRITGLSDGGVRLFVEDHVMPAQFIVIFSTGRSRQCRVQWRNGCEFGAEYVDNRRSPGEVFAHAC
jgi:hypothetical protein